ncbi:MAG: addiction module protein [Gracilimonas sp.]|uniref:addiction module protein n=1 Tax=Gracilimonas TaxID=649462 RepID=UPI001B1D803D|nr:addiction module protein [Gracilimonas sp.]MBO6584720.1 addiction module protein [Gracilimonas sp.]MBO6616009.1 addiction module protein [Gracilimonas sp.]
MGNQIVIEHLTQKEKLLLMEDLWKDISKEADYTPPVWHKNVLDNREQALKEGKDSFTDWKKAKEDIRRQIS